MIYDYHSISSELVSVEIFINMSLVHLLFGYFIGRFQIDLFYMGRAKIGHGMDHMATTSCA